jgi:hypothetical protein
MGGIEMTQENCTWDPKTQIAIIWGIEDVQMMNNGLTDEQAFTVLKRVEKNHDANDGIVWDTLKIWAEELFPEVKHEGWEAEDDDD